MNSVTITLPIPPTCLSPNGRAHWAKRSAATKQQRSDAMYYALEKIVGPSPKWDRAVVTIRWFAKDEARIPDIDNAIGSTKGARDGLQDAGIIRNDRGVETIHVWRVTDRARPRVELTIQPITQPTSKE